MKRTITVILLAILTLSLVLCGCDNTHSHNHEKDDIIKKTDIRQNDDSVIVVYEDGYERTYSATQPIEVFVNEGGSRSARAIGISTHPYFYWIGGDNYQTQDGNRVEFVTSKDSIVIIPGDSVTSKDAFVIIPEDSATQQDDIVVEVTLVGTAYVQLQGSIGGSYLYSFFEHNGKKYQDCAIDVLNILWEKTTLIDFATGYENEPIDSIADFRNFGNLEAVILPTSIKKVDRKAFDGCIKLTTVYYCGTAEEWAGVELESGESVGKDNKVETIPNSLASCTVYFYSEKQPAVDGNHWHFVDGKPVAW